MSFSVFFTPEAQNDVKEVYEWYESKSTGLGDRFIERIDEKLAVLTLTKGIGSVRYDDIRCTIIPGFPYLIHYGINTSKQMIIAYRIFHASRKPLWE